MKRLALVTGATGTVGHAIARELRRRGRAVRALVRSADRARAYLGPEVELVEGDVTDATAVRRAMEGCAAAYHAAGLPEQWLPDPALFTRVNVEGTRNMVEAALAVGVESFVYTSTIDVFVIAPGVEFDESRIDVAPKPTYYERSKQEADRIVTAALDRGLPAVFLHPSGVYGPAPITTGVNDFIKRLVRGEIPMLLPGGFPVVYSGDVGLAHVLADDFGSVGARFILSDAYRTLEEIARAVVAAAGRGSVPRVMPMWVARAVSAGGELVARVTSRPPLIPSGQLQFLALDARPSARRAEREFGWTPLAFEEGIRRTVVDLQARGEI